MPSWRQPYAGGPGGHVECAITMDEHSALDVIVVRAIETQDRARAVWSDAERAWASRAAAGVVGEMAAADVFAAQRAALVWNALTSATGHYWRISTRTVKGKLCWTSRHKQGKRRTRNEPCQVA